MEHVPGVQLLQKWHTMNGVEHLDLIQAVGKIMKQLGALSFPAYGSLYLRNASLAPAEKIDLPGDYSIGPYCSTTYWDCSADESKYYLHRPANRGPCKPPPSFMFEFNQLIQ